MMTQLQFYLIKLAEEGSEVAQIALKTPQFGPNEVMSGQPFSNFERTHQELDDLWAMVEELNDKFGFGYTPNRERIEAKKAKVRKYLGYSIHLGMVEGETDVCEHPMATPPTPIEHRSPSEGSEYQRARGATDLRKSMTDEQLIAQQAKRIAELEEELALRNEAERKVHMEIYGIGGPLNDNKLGYTKAQMVPFARIADQLWRAA